ncbi:hypothetical protein DFJ73DRAFT_769572 [Zopfochytrium polystomum]|nr:hypothetical protein DFJ73DRAFT_769572 [Zopfochytrium polystomum]
MSLVIGNPLPQTRFDVCWLEPLSGGQQWSKLMGCALIMYCYSFSQRKSLWNVVLVHAVSGFLGTIIENVWVAAANCKIMVPGDTASSYAYVLLVNELNWIPHESTIIVYSYLKTRVILKGVMLERMVNYFLGGVFLLYVACRANIGRLRFQHNLLSDDDIALAHNYVYILWIIADVVLFVLLIWNVVDHLSKSLAASSKVIKTLLNSSLPRFAVILFNTMVLSVLNFVLRTPGLDSMTLLTLKNLSKFTSLVKGTYPTLMLLDVLMTKFMLYGRDAEDSGTGGIGGRSILGTMSTAKASEGASPGLRV